MARRRQSRAASERKTNDDELVDWFFMRPCVGVTNLCPPLCTWSQLQDGTYSIADVMRFNITLDEMIRAAESVKSN